MFKHSCITLPVCYLFVRVRVSVYFLAHSIPPCVEASISFERHRYNCSPHTLPCWLHIHCVRAFVTNANCSDWDLTKMGIWLLLLLIFVVFTVASSSERMKMYAKKARLKLKQLLTDIATRSLPCFQVLFTWLPDTCDTPFPDGPLCATRWLQISVGLVKSETLPCSDR